MRLNKLLNWFVSFVTGASTGLLALILVDQLICPGIFVNSNRIVLGCGLLTGVFGIITTSGTCDG
jgi:hypothetical protein